MKVIMLQDVKTVGKKGQVVEVSDGYARNVLLKKGQAREATSKNMNDLKLKQANEEKMARENLAAAKELAQELKDKEIRVQVKAGEGGRVFGSVSAKEISEEIKKQLGYEVDKKKLVLEAPIKTLGCTEVGIKLHPQVTAALKVHVTEM